MKNKNYYMDLADRWFDALLTGGEERELKSFLATTEDPDFDEIKAVAIGLHHRQNDCYILVYGQKSTNPNLVLDDMTATLEGIFGEGEDVGDELFDLFNPAL